jgi:transposase
MTITVWACRSLLGLGQSEHLELGGRSPLCMPRSWAWRRGSPTCGRHETEEPYWLIEAKGGEVGLRRLREVIDSQSVKADAVVGSDSRDFDGGKLTNGRKQHALLDTLGLLLAVTVTAADIGDRAAAQVLLAQVAAAHHRLALVWADGGYTGSLVEHSLAVLALVLAVVKRSDEMRGFVVLPKRQIVERFFAHLMRSRRLVRDFERSTSSAEAMVYWSMTMRLLVPLPLGHLPARREYGQPPPGDHPHGGER